MKEKHIFLKHLCFSNQVRIPNTENSYLITGLSPGVTYIVQVYAVIKEIQSDADKIEATTGECRLLKRHCVRLRAT